MDRDKDNSAARWKDWCQSLWNNIESAWLERDLPDLAYKRTVVFPIVLSAYERSHATYKTVIDIGCGDGFVVDLLLQELNSKGKKPDEVVLIDRSQEFIRRALSRASLAGSHSLVGTIEDISFSFMRSLARPKLLLSTLVAMELYDLSALIQPVSEILAPGDSFCLVAIDPEFSSWLLEIGKARLAAMGTDGADWDWAAEYPVTINDRIYYFPHFQRDLNRYAEVAGRFGLRIADSVRLSVPNTPETRSVFEQTIYGTDIIGRPSAIALSLVSSSGEPVSEV